VEWNATESYRVSDPSRNRRCDLVERVPREASAGEAPQQLRRHRLTLEQAPYAVGLGLETRDGGSRRLSRDQTTLEVDSDRSVAVAAPRKLSRAAFGQAHVVDE